MTKELFIATINNIQEYSEFENKLYELGIDILDQECICNLLKNLEEILQRETGDEKGEFGNIAYFMWELDFGKKYRDGCAVDTVNGEQVNIVLRTPEDLWNSLPISKK